jgi:hypothetical protein
MGVKVRVCECNEGNNKCDNFIEGRDFGELLGKIFLLTEVSFFGVDRHDVAVSSASDGGGGPVE